ncbi:CPBP family intramembrane glutamic endopeptidase [Streptococcus hongkongensis]
MLSKFKWFLIAFGIVVVEQLPILLVKKEQPFWQVILISMLLLVITALTYWFAKKKKLLADKASLTSDSAILWIGLGFAALTIIKFIGGIILFLEHGANANTANQMALEQAGFHPMLLFILAAIVAPIIEETVFRGIIFGKVFGAKSYLGLVISSLLFGGLHMPSDIGSWVIYAGMGLVLGFVYHKTKNLSYCMIIHFINNGLAVLLMLLLPHIR